MDVLTHIVVWLNWAANLLGRSVLAPIAVLPGWLSATLVAVGSGLLLLVLFKHTSHQRALKAVRRDIKANLLALRLFQDSIVVTLQAQVCIIIGSLKLLTLAGVPMLIMTVPVCLLLGQLGLWYQHRPLRTGEETVVTLHLNGVEQATWPAVKLHCSEAAEVIVGPVRMFSQRAVCWNIKAHSAGLHELLFQVDGQDVAKELVVGTGYLRVSACRPEWSWSEVLLHPAEGPFPPNSPVRAIEIAYPHRNSWTSGTDHWLVYWFIVSLLAALCFRPLVNVNL